MLVLGPGLLAPAKGRGLDGSGPSPFSPFTTRRDNRHRRAGRRVVHSPRENGRKCCIFLAFRHKWVPNGAAGVTLSQAKENVREAEIKLAQ